MTDSVPDPAPSAGEPLVDFIRANRDRYTRNALTQQLLASGHSPESVSNAWTEADAEGAPAMVTNHSQPRRARQTALQLIAVMLALGALLLGEVTLLGASHGRPMMLLYLVLYPLQILFLTRWIVGQIEASGSLRRGDLAMTVGWLVTPFIALVALMGVCFGYGATFGCVLECP